MYQQNILKTTEWVKTITELARRNQIIFIEYVLNIVRQCLIFNYTDKKLLRLSSPEEKFLNNFSPYINNNNIIEITKKEKISKNV